MYLERVQLLKTLYETRKRAIDCREAINRKEHFSPKREPKKTKRKANKAQGV